MVIRIQLTKRQALIVDLVKDRGPITGESIAQHLDIKRATLRPDLAILTMSGILEARPRVGYYYSGKSIQTLQAQEVRAIRVKDVKAPPVVVQEDTSVYDAIVSLFMEDVGTLFVVGANSLLLGAVSRKDLLKATIGGGDLHKLPIGLMMTRLPQLVTVSPEDSVLVAAQKMISYEIDAIPVVQPLPGGRTERDLQIIGRISKTTIARLFLELGGQE